ncbi:MAG: endonuclease/exonuclease/phosphatase family protein [Treponema sp.]|nr:endonuclease/exonuclease/phosphatase family protein [Treponema sp.]
MKRLFAFPRFCLAGLFAAVIAFGGCAVSGSGETENNAVLTLMTWNIHNLFDGKDDGYEYAEFLQSSGWSNEKYRGRINTIADAVHKIGALPDIIMFQEIESLQILEDIAALLKRDYLWSHFAGNRESAAGLGIISCIPITDIKTHSITIGGDTTPRPVLETRIQAEHGGFIVFICHWKSKTGGDNTELIRRASVRVILRRIHEIWKDEPDTGIIIAGDLNENFNEFYIQGSGIICALLPDDPDCAALAGDTEEGQKDFIVVSGDMPPVPVCFPEETVVLYSPWVNELEGGTYYYRNKWETIDHFLVSIQFFDNSGWEYDNTSIVNYEPFGDLNGVPVSYNQRTGNGLSDHLPLLLTLKSKNGN